MGIEDDYKAVKLYRFNVTFNDVTFVVDRNHHDQYRLELPPNRFSEAVLPRPLFDTFEETIEAAASLSTLIVKARQKSKEANLAWGQVEDSIIENWEFDR